MIVKKSSEFQQLVEDAARQLVSIETIGGAHYVRTPLLYVSGETVVVRVERAGDRYFVTDFGAGHVEAEWIDGDSAYRSAALAIAKSAGICFEHLAFFVEHSSEAKIAGAIVSVANCSQEAVLASLETTARALA